MNQGLIIFVSAVTSAFLVHAFLAPASAANANNFVECSGITKCALPVPKSRYLARFGTALNYGYVETGGQKSVVCGSRLMGDLAHGKKKTCSIFEIKMPAEKWSRCAVQGDDCNTKLGTNEVRRVRWGAGTTWVYFYTSGQQFTCAMPFRGLGPERECQISSKKFKTTWTVCGDKEGATCKLARIGLHLVRYIEKGGKKRNILKMVSGQELTCSLKTFGRDPAPKAAKRCEKAALVPLGNGVIAPALEKEFKDANAYAKDKVPSLETITTTRKFSHCVKDKTIYAPIYSRSYKPGSSPPSWQVGVGWQNCKNSQTGPIYVAGYGSKSKSRFFYLQTQGLATTPCTHKLMGDPVPGEGGKTCYNSKVSNPSDMEWMKCANQDQKCKVGLTKNETKAGAYVKVRYGKGKKWVHFYANHDFQCFDRYPWSFGLDPAPGVRKECQVDQFSKITPKWVKCGEFGGTCKLPTNKVTYLIRLSNSDNTIAHLTLASGNSFWCNFGGLTGFNPDGAWTFSFGSGGFNHGSYYKRYKGLKIGSRVYQAGGPVDPAFFAQAKSCYYAIPADGFKPKY